MRLILLHSDEFEYEPKKKAIKAAEEIEKKVVSVGESLVVMMSVEKDDEQNFEEVANKSVFEIEKITDELKIQNVVVYPWVHLTSNPSRPDIALKVMKQIEEILVSKGKYDAVFRAPFGWYKGFTIKVKGHPLSELSREFSSNIKEVSEEESLAIKAEDESKHEFYVFTEKGAKEFWKEYKFKPKSKFKTFFDYETQKKRVSETPPAHVDLMQKLELVDYEPGSDAGNMRWYPQGWLIKRLLEDHVTTTHVNNGAYCVETPIMYDFHHPSLEKYMNRFPARQYVINSGSDRYFLRFAACFGQFLIGSDALISYKHLPLKLFEMTHYSFRREQRGELAALRRLRTFSMPDQHTLVADIDSARDEFATQFYLCQQMLASFEVEYEAVFRFQTDFYIENEDWIKQMISSLNKPVMLELFDKRYAYFVCKFEFNFIDGQSKAASLSTVQIDVENGERFDITYVNDKGEKVHPLILHTSLSGAIERVVYAMLETAADKIKRGLKPAFPLWLSPVQVRICPISDDDLDFCNSLADRLNIHNIRVDIDDRNERVGKKIRDAEKSWIPYIIVIGKNEQNTNQFKARLRSGEEIEYEADTLISEITTQVQSYPFRQLPLSRQVSLRPKFFSRSD
ncbi:MAG: threonine--tRNA ligase [Candidatus Heimdallarchaeota archaeon]|nr:threonine--tRNA ligase [Candidatus Heimdallarchaeota archaeon]MDH5644646.1 threonine--tRNA ligase [Candidatus Heimdallarchaeota archaeon]